MGLPCSERQQTTGADQPSADIEQTDIEPDNLSESVLEEDTVSSSNEESCSPLLGNTVSSGQHSPSGSIAKVNDKYVIPMRRRQPAASTCTVIFTGTRKNYLTWQDRTGQDSGTYGSIAIKAETT